MVRSLEISLQDVFTRRFGAAPAMPESPISDNTVAYLAERSSCRSYLERPVDPALVETLAAANVLTIKAKKRRERRILRTPFKNERTIPSFRLSDSVAFVYETGFFTKTSGVPIVRGMHDVTFLTISTR